MATTAAPTQAAHLNDHSYGEQSGIWSWLTTVDHKRIGILYGVSAFFFFLVGGIEALIIAGMVVGAAGTMLTQRG